MIPKKIHYCWFGRKPKPDSVLKYIQTWIDKMPDYEIIEWNEDNFDVNIYAYTKEAYFAGKYAFVSDVARLYALFNNGGIYFDTDIKVVKAFDNELMMNDAFIGFEHDRYIGTAVIACNKNEPIIEEFLDVYKKIHFFTNFKYDETTNVFRITELFNKKGLILNNYKQKIENFVVYPQNYFSAKHFRTGEYYNDSNTYAIHDFMCSWTNTKYSVIERIVNKLKIFFNILRYYI